MIAPVISSEMAERCNNHHNACDCREYRFQLATEALRVIYKLVSEYKQMNQPHAGYVEGILTRITMTAEDALDD